MQLYPPLINLLETTVEEDTLFTKLKGDRVRSPEDLPRRVIAGLLDPESFQYSEADGDKQWQATWKSWNDELRLEVSWSASNGWYGCFYWKNWPLLAGEGRAETTFGVIFLHFRGIYSQVQRPLLDGPFASATRCIFLAGWSPSHAFHAYPRQEGQKVLGDAAIAS